MRRRAFLASTLGLAALPRLAGAQVAARVPRVGWISGYSMQSAAPFFNAFRSGLASLGYIEGQNIQIEARYADDVRDRVPALIEELVRIPVDLVMTHGPATRIVVKQLTALPVVYVLSADPVEAGLAQSLARPGGNATGITLMSVELNGKRLELLREFVPTLRKTAIIANPFHLGEHLERRESEQTAERLGITVQYLPVRDIAELEASFSAISEDAPEAIVVFPDPLVIGNRQRIIDVGMARRIPVISGWPVAFR
jgi:putative ABC transport system substrate-binding protein